MDESSRSRLLTSEEITVEITPNGQNDALQEAENLLVCMYGYVPV